MYRTIVVGTDGSTTARAAVLHAAQLAHATGAALHVVCVRLPEPVLATTSEFVATGFDAAAAADEVAASALHAAMADADAVGATAYTHRPIGNPADCLVETARSLDADLLVVGNRGMHGTRRLLGSIPNKVTHHAPCHVLVVQTS